MAVLAAAVALPGCGRKEDAASSPPLPPPPLAPQTQLQTEIGRLCDIPHEHDPKKRPVVLSARAESRRDWLMKVLDRGYAESGSANSRWDGLASKALQAYADYSRVGATDERYVVLSNAVAAAESAGCKDPLLDYMRVRYGVNGSIHSKPELALAYLNAFRAVHASQYHPLLKFFAGYRAIEAAHEAEPSGNRSPLIELVTGALEDAAHDTNAPAAEIFDAVFLWVDYTKGKGWVEYMMKDVQPNLEKTWGHEEAYYRLRGHTEISLAWEARGGGFAGSVSDKGWQEFKRHLDTAEDFLDRAWQMNPSNAYTAYLMMQLELGQGQGRDRMDQWFQRAMALDPYDHDAASLMAFYLEPRWYGSEQAALQFARTCVTSTHWLGRVPLVLPEVHRSLAGYLKLADSPDYWQRPGVWDDVRNGYEKFFKLNPLDSGWRHDYARDAYVCGQYQAFLEQTRLFNGWTNYAFFGGKDKFDQMLARAAAAK